MSEVKAPARDIVDMSGPLRESGLIPDDVRLVRWTAPDGTTHVHGTIEFHARTSMHADLVTLPRFAATDILLSVAEKTSRQLMQHIADWIPLRALRYRREVRLLEDSIRDLIHVLEHVEEMHPIIQPSHRNLAAQRGRQVLVDLETASRPGVR